MDTSQVGKRLIPSLIDALAATEPEKTFISVSRTVDPRDGFENITFATLARAVNRCAWWLYEELGQSESFDTLYTQLPPQDLRHPILVVAAAKVGYKVTSQGSSPNATIRHADLPDVLLFSSQHD